MKLNLEIKTLTERNELIKQLQAMPFEPVLSATLDVTHYANGDEIIEAKTPAQFHQLGEECMAAFIKNEDGVHLYNYHAVVSHRFLAPEGYHVPTASEWRDLEAEVKNTKTALSCGYTYGERLWYGARRAWLWSQTSELNSDKAYVLRLDFNDLHIECKYKQKSTGYPVRVIKNT